MTTHIVIQFAGILCPPEDAHGGALQRSRLAAKEILQLSAQRPPATVIEARVVLLGSELRDALVEFAEGGFLAKLQRLRGCPTTATVPSVVFLQCAAK